MAEGGVRVFVGGDICPIGRMSGPFGRGESDLIFGDVLDLIRGCDFAVANLECPLAEESRRPVPKSGPNLRALPGAAETLHRSGFGAVGLANNHIMDFGQDGLKDTLSACASADLGTFGAGATLSEARKPLIVTRKGVRIAFLAIAEDERCLATSSRPGANPADPIWVVRTLAEHRGRFDRLVILLHGGTEGFQYPAPWLRETCRFLVEQGADVVVCQHSHCVGSMEAYQGGTILYGQGNFIFDYADHGPLGGQGLGLVITFHDGQPAKVALHPIEQLAGGGGIRRSSEREAQALLERLRVQSDVLEDPERYSQVWNAFCDQRRAGFLTRLFGFGRWLQRLNRREWLFRHLTPADLLRIYNLVSCESHRGALRTSLDNLIDRTIPPEEGRG
ncbi:CapA family protein [Geothrix mesophila]|uniref:CapA family protein n=1 Tax=Geothrix mesophila TaxID=2922723 RepID=UPI002434EE48|nr:CapA family protein [Geothrix sp. SG198]